MVRCGSRAAAALLARAAACALLAAAAAGEALPAVTAVAFSECGSGAALAELVRGALAAGGVRARAVPPPAECAAPDSRECLAAALAALARGSLVAAVLPAAGHALPAPPRLRDAGVEAWGALEPAEGEAARRACWARPPLRSLAELATPERAPPHRAPPAALRALAPDPRYFCSSAEGAEGAEGGSAECSGRAASALVGPAGEARVLAGAARDAGLHLQAVALGAAWDAARALAAAPAALVCGRGLDARALRAAGARPLGPPPCARADCPFDVRPLLKLSAARELARWPAARAQLDRLALPAGGARALALRAADVGAERAAREALAAAARRAPPELRAAVLVPLSTRRDVGDARALAAAAALAEEDAAEGEGEGEMRFKVELVDSGCAEARAFKYLTDALGAEFHALSAVFGGACARALAAVARQGAALALPTLSFGSGAGAADGTLLAAGDPRDSEAAATALLAALGWRRCATLGAARVEAEVAEAAAEAEGEAEAEGAAARWAERAAARGVRVLVLGAEDARAARAALCASGRAGLTPARGAAFVATGALGARDAGWLAAAAPCALAEQAEGLLRLTPEWAARWEQGEAGAAWAARWRARAGPGAGAGRPPAAAALLYDALRLWARALARLVRAHPAALHDLHRADTFRSLMEEVLTPYSGLTGGWEWEGAGRGGALLVVQRQRGRDVRVGRWTRRAGLQLDRAALRWATPDGAAPVDGVAACPWAAVAAALRLSCAAAGGALAAAALLALAALAAAVARHLRRRAALDRAARLHAFGMRALGPRAGAPDRWELPRSRVVINRKLGAGAFGAVYGGRALLAGAGGERRAWRPVAVKTLKAGARAEEKLDFLSEAEAMKRFSHPHVVRLLGVVTRTEPVCTVMELMERGDLKGFLRARRGAGAGAGAGAALLTRLARDAALGLAYLARMRYVHRDVAARNCLVSAELRVKLADFGMTRVVFEKEYYRFGRKGMLPVRWMAPESVARGVFSAASDVWSFGVLLYEVCTLGALPYRGLADAEVVRRAREGAGPPLPARLHAEPAALIRSCWRVRADARPAAAALARLLAERPRLLAPCADEPPPPRSAGTTSTYLSEDEAPPDHEPAEPLASSPFLPPEPAEPLASSPFLPPEPSSPLASDPFLPPEPSSPLASDPFLPPEPSSPLDTDPFLPP